MTHPRGQCFFCDQQAPAQRRIDRPGMHDVSCSTCGEYTVDEDAILELQVRPLEGRKRSNAAFWVREFNGEPLIDLKRVDFFLHELEAPSPGERAARFLRYLASKFSALSIYENIINISDPEVMTVTWSPDENEVLYLLMEYLGALGHVKADHMGGSSLRVVIQPSGWQVLEQLKSPNQSVDHGFIAMWFSDATTDLREKGLKPAITMAGYRPFLVDESLKNRSIDSEIVANIRRSRFLIADLHAGGPVPRGSVYFEAGYAMGHKVPVYWTCHQDDLDKKHISFDVRQYVFTAWGKDPWDVFAKKLSSIIEANEGAGPLKDLSARSTFAGPTTASL